MQIAIPLGQWIEDERKRRGLTMEQLQVIGNYSRGNLHKLRQGAVDPKLSTLANIASAFQMDAGDLLIAAGYSNGTTLASTLALLTTGQLAKGKLERIQAILDEQE